MKRKLYVFTMAFFAVIYIVTFVFLPFYNPIYFYTQHISLFLFMAMFIFYMMKLGYDRLIKNVKRQEIVKICTVIIFAGILFGFSNLQLYLIETYQTKEQQYCSYYDTRGNLIFYSYQPNTCPVLEIETRTSDVLEFTVVENYSGIAERGYMNLDMDKEYSYQGELITHVSITYNEYSQIGSVTTIKYSDILLYNEGEEFNIFNYYKLIVENSIFLDGQNRVSMESRQSKEVIKDTFYDGSQPIDFSTFIKETEYKKYTSTKYYNDQNSDYQIVLEEGLYTNADYNVLVDVSEIFRVIDVFTDNGYYDLQLGDYNKDLLDTDFNTEGYDLYPDSQIRYDITNLVVEQPYYHYFDEEGTSRETTYNRFESFIGWTFNSDVKPGDSFLRPSTERSSFKYLGKDYMEHGDYYSIFNVEDYGYSLTTKSAINENDSEVRTPYLEILSIQEPALYDEMIGIYDYRYRMDKQYSDREDQIYQWNPLVFVLIDWTLNME